MKTDGKTWNAYLASWPEGQWFDDSNDKCNDGDMPATVPDDAVITFSTGVVFKNAADAEGKNLVKHFQAWLKAQSTVRVLIEIDARHKPALVDLIKTMNGKVLS